MSGNAAAESVEGMVIEMGCTIGIPSISQCREFTRGGSGIVKEARSQGVWGTSVPQYGLGKMPCRGFGERSPPEAEAKCEIRVQF